MLVYLNGDFLPLEQARVPVEDRGFLFADGVYEVARIYGGWPYLLDEHLARLAQGLLAIQIEYDDFGAIERAAHRLIEDNGIRGDGTVYIQVTRGAATRKHAFPPAGTQPTVFVAARPFKQYPDSHYDLGVAAITVPDTRWARCDIKSISLLPNVLANQAAQAAGAFEALLVRDGVVVEGSHSNVWALRDGGLITYPASNYILAGITRTKVFELAVGAGVPAAEGVITHDELYDVDELFLSGTTVEIMPLVRVDGRQIGAGRPGPVSRALLEAYRSSIPRPAARAAS